MKYSGRVRIAGAVGRFAAVAVVGAFLAAARPVVAHEVAHRISHEGAAVVVTVGFADGASFDYESYEVYRPGESVPYQVGRTDAHGRVVFLPDTAGTWRVKAFTADGHGLDTTVDTDASGAVTDAGGSVADRFPRLVGGLAILLGAFGLMSLFYGKTRGGGT